MRPVREHGVAIRRVRRRTDERGCPSYRRRDWWGLCFGHVVAVGHEFGKAGVDVVVVLRCDAALLLAAADEETADDQGDEGEEADYDTGDCAGGEFFPA